MMKKSESDRTNSRSVPATPWCESNLALAAHLLRQALYSGSYEGIPTNRAGLEDIDEILLYVRDVQLHLSSLAKGNISTPLPLAGYTGSLLREMQENLHHAIWTARRLTAGDFSCDAGCMGELSESFEVMGKTLQAALVRLEQQKQDLTELSETLRREIKARATVEKDLRREQARLQKLASTDPLTGIPNRRQFFQTAIRELERIRRTKSNACLAMLDIDHFKALNDSLGHTAGDKALQHVATIISNIIRPYDIVGRYGGDEFIFLFPEITRDNAYALLERIRASVEKEQLSTGKGSPPITVSIGLTVLTVDETVTGATLDKAISLADEALYKAKNKSRNRICIV